MKYTVKYSHPDPYVNIASAIRDIRNHTGMEEAEWNKLFQFDRPFPITSLASAKKWVQFIEVFCSFRGIHGYPVRALKRAFFGQHPLTFLRGNFGGTWARERGGADAYYRRWYRGPNRRLSLLADYSTIITPADALHYRAGYDSQDFFKEW